MATDPEVSPTCEVVLTWPTALSDSVVFCNQPTTSFYPTLAGGTMALCEKHGKKHAAYATRWPAPSSEGTLQATDDTSPISRGCPFCDETGTVFRLGGSELGATEVEAECSACSGSGALYSDCVPTGSMLKELIGEQANRIGQDFADTADGKQANCLRESFAALQWLHDNVQAMMKLSFPHGERSPDLSPEGSNGN